MSHYTPTPTLSQLYDFIPDWYRKRIEDEMVKGNEKAVEFLKKQLKQLNQPTCNIF